MKSNIITYLASTAAAIGMVASVQATQIVGSIQMSGQVGLDTTDLATASVANFTGLNPAGLVVSGTGSYSGVPTGLSSPPVTFAGFNIVAGAQSISPLWTFTYNGNVYSFDLGTITSVGSALGVNTRDTGDLLVKGSGTVSITGFDTTAANWSFDITDTAGGTGTSFTFGFAQSDTSLPDGGTTAMLMGAALSGLALIRRKLA